MGDVCIIDYGLGNVRAFANVYDRLNIKYSIATSPRHINGADRLILPGVGAFDWAMNRLNASGFRDALDEVVLNRRVPILGVCVGMQMMAARSEEGVMAGLGWIDADVLRFSGSNFGGRGAGSKPLPHMGWNDVVVRRAENLFYGMASPKFYFLHSYIVVPRNEENILAETEYGRGFASAVSNGNVYGTQFHPEKSHRWGMDLLRNFARLGQPDVDGVGIC